MTYVRWHAVAYYRSDSGLVDVEYSLEELGDLHDFVEAGPHWDTIDRIEVRRVNHSEADGQTLTVEQAQQR